MDLANVVIAPRTAAKVPLNRTVVESTMTASLGGLLFGFDTAVIAGVTQALTQKFHLSPTSLGFTVAIALWGTIVGAASRRLRWWPVWPSTQRLLHSSFSPR